MKKVQLATVLILFSLPFLAFSQLAEEEKSMSMGVNSALVLELPNVGPKLVDKVWKKYLKKYDGKTKKNRKTKELFTDDADISALGGANSVDVYARIEPMGEDVEILMWVDLGGAFLSSSSHPDKFVEAEKMMMRFAIEVAKEQTMLELKAEEKILKKTENALKKLRREKEGYHKDIEDAKERIAKAEKNIEKNIVEQEETNNKITAQQGVIDEVKKRLSNLDN